MDAVRASADPDITVLEREAQLGALLDYADEAARRQGRLVLIAGEAGVGKSTLVEQLRPRLPDAEWLQGACDGLFTPRPLGPLLDMAAELGDGLAERARSGGNRELVFTGLLERIGTPDRLSVLCIEDIHWADETTLDLIRFLGRRIRETSTLVLTTYRDEALSADERLSVVIGDLSRERITRRIHLNGLSLDGVAQLSQTSGHDPRRLHRLTGGNPFFLTEVLRAGGSALPPSVRDATLARLAPLSGAARNILEVGALLGLRMEHSTLTDVSGGDVPALDEVLSSGLLAEEGTSLRFRHELARLAVEESIPVHRRMPMHRRIFDVLLATGCEDETRLAFHAEGCADAAAVLELAPRAAAQAARMGSVREAAAQYRRALRFTEDAPAATRAELYDGLADAYTLLDDFDQASEARERAVDYWTELGDVRREADSRRRGSWALNGSNRVDEAFEYCDRAVELLTPLGPSPELAWARAALARLLLMRGDHAESVRSARKARALAAELGLDDVMSDAMNTEACASGSLGLPWRRKLDRALELAMAIPNAPLAARAYYNLYGRLLDDLQFEEGDACYRQAVAYADEHDLRTYSLCLRRGQAMNLVTRGRWDEAVALARAQATEPDTGVQQHTLPRLVVALVSARRGEDDDVQEMLDEALEAAEGCGQPQYVVPARLARAEIAWLRGDEETAWKELALARDLAPEGQELVRDIELWSHRTGKGGSAEGQSGPVGLELTDQPGPAARAWDERSCPYDAALALLGSDEETHLREAVVRFDELGAVAPARMARQKMRELGCGSIPTGSRATTRAHPKGLTQREQEVLDLVAVGLRNRDIAERLFLSPRTVAVHVSNVIRKLGVTSRTEAATWALGERSSAI